MVPSAGSFSLPDMTHGSTVLRNIMLGCLYDSEAEQICLGKVGLKAGVTGKNGTQKELQSLAIVQNASRISWATAAAAVRRFLVGTASSMQVTHRYQQ